MLLENNQSKSQGLPRYLTIRKPRQRPRFVFNLQISAAEKVSVRPLTSQSLLSLHDSTKLKLQV